MTVTGYNSTETTFHNCYMNDSYLTETTTSDNYKEYSDIDDYYEIDRIISKNESLEAIKKIKIEQRKGKILKNCILIYLNKKRMFRCKATFT